MRWGKKTDLMSLNAIIFYGQPFVHWRIGTAYLLLLILLIVQGNGSVQKGMPHKIYHGKTGRVYNVSRRAVGIIINKRYVFPRQEVYRFFANELISSLDLVVIFCCPFT